MCTTILETFWIKMVVKLLDLYLHQKKQDLRFPWMWHKGADLKPSNVHNKPENVSQNSRFTVTS